LTTLLNMDMVTPSHFLCSSSARKPQSARSRGSWRASVPTHLREEKCYAIPAPCSRITRASYWN